MKPSEVRNSTLMYYFPYNSSSSDYSRRVEKSTAIWYRTPMTYSPRTYVMMKQFKMLPIKAYSCNILEADAVIWAWDYWFYTRPNEWSYERWSSLPKPYNKPFWLDNYLSQMEVQCNIEFLNKLNSRKVSLLEEMKNRKDTWETMIRSATRMGRYYKQMLRDPFKFVKESRKKARRLGRPVTKRAIKSYGDAWLEGRYHWIPTYLTMRDAFIGLKDTGPLGQVYHKLENVVSWEETLSQGNTSGNAGNPLTFKHEMLVTFKRGCWISLEDEVEALARRYGTGGFTDLAAVAWELTPWSLVVDWVVPVTDILLAMNATKGVETHLGWATRKEHRYKGTPVKRHVAKFDDGQYSKTRTHCIQEASVGQYESYSRKAVNINDLEIRPYIMTPSDNQKIYRAIDALSFFTGSKMGQKIISGRI